MSTIWTRYHALHKERRDKRTELMREYDIEFAHRMRALQEECEKEDGGHLWRFSHYGPVGGEWFRCARCSKSRFEGKE